MTDKLSGHVEAILESASREDLERLVRGIDRDRIVNWVKHSKHLQQQVFSGFRPTHLQWERVPTLLAQDAEGHLDRVYSLLKKWRMSNKALCQRVAEEVDAETIEDDVAKLLSSLGIQERDHLLWAMLLDEREEIQSALTNGLREALTNETSTLMVKAEKHQLAQELKEANQEIADLKSQLGQLEEMQSNQQWLLDEATQADTQLQKAIQQRDAAQAEIETLQNQLTQQQTYNHELKHCIDNLKASLEATISNQQETDKQVKIPTLDCDGAWDKAVNDLALHLKSALPEQESADNSAQVNQRWGDWQSWQRIEVDLVQPLLDSSASASAGNLVNAEQAQKLLALRWYLLEWIKLSLLERLRDRNLTVNPIKF
jgi:DNA repair exonuclease SbcCD ATPase subunit